MSDRSAIEWTDATWNPLRGCTRVSPGCVHCYAEIFAERFRGVPGHPYEFGFDLRLVPEKLTEPLRWNGKRTVFANSMSDLFHERVPLSYIRAVVAVMAATPWHTYQVLTKRALRMRQMLSGPLRSAAGLRHVWWGASVEDRRHGLPRIAELQATPVRTRFLSIEPLLEDLGAVQLDGIAWVIVGGESGHQARPMEKAWVTSLRDQCWTADVPFFFKQWGGRMKKQNGRLLDGRTYDEMPQRSRVPIASLKIRRRLIARFDRVAGVFSAAPIPLRPVRNSPEAVAVNLA